MSAGRRLGLRLLFGSVLLSLPAMIIVRERAGEPYPGLYQPAFDSLSMRGDVFERDEVVVRIRDRAGVQHRIEVAEIVRAPQVESRQRLTVTRAALRNRTRMRTPDAVEYLRARAADLGIADPVRMIVTWYATARSPHDRDRAQRGDVRQSYAVRLDP